MPWVPAKSVSQSGPAATGLNGAEVLEFQIYLKRLGAWAVKCLKTVSRITFR